MFSFFKTLPWYFKVGAAVVLIVIVFAAFGRVMSWRYDRERKAYQEERKQWVEIERPKLIADAEAKEKKIVELETENLAYRAAADEGKKVDDALAQKIEQLGEDAASEEAATDQPTTCANRAHRTCQKLAKLKPPIIVDCAVYERKMCG